MHRGGAYHRVEPGLRPTERGASGASAAGSSLHFSRTNAFFFFIEKVCRPTQRVPRAVGNTIPRIYNNRDSANYQFLKGQKCVLPGSCSKRTVWEKSADCGTDTDKKNPNSFTHITSFSKILTSFQK